MKHTLYVIGLAALLAAAIGCGSGEYEEVAVQNRSSALSAPAETAKSSMAGIMSPASETRTKEAPPVAPSQIPQRAVIRNGSLSVRVDSVEKAEDKVVELVLALGGYVDSTDSTDLATVTPTLNMKIRVPSANFDDVLNKIEALGTRLSKKIATEDVTASLADMSARLKIMRAQEEVYRRMLSNARSTQEMMEVQDKLMNLRGTIEGLGAQQKSLSQFAALSSIQLTLQQSAEGAVAATNDPNWAKEAWGASTGSLSGIVRHVGGFLIWTLVFAPFWLPLAWFARHFARGFKSKHIAQPKPRFDVNA